LAAASVRLATTTDGEAIGANARARILANYIWAERLRSFDALLHSGDQE
jgi:hypothetical protein